MELQSLLVFISVQIIGTQIIMYYVMRKEILN